MKSKMQGFLSGAIAAVLLFTCITAMAASSRTITVNTDMMILVNGSVFEPTDANGEPVPVFEFDGTTYAPLRALADAYGLVVGYDSTRRMATVDSPKDGDASGSNPSGSQTSGGATDVKPSRDFEDAMTGGALDQAWNVMGAVTNEGLNGVRIGSSTAAGAIQLEGILKPGDSKYTISFEAFSILEDEMHRLFRVYLNLSGFDTPAFDVNHGYSDTNGYEPSGYFNHGLTMAGYYATRAMDRTGYIDAHWFPLENRGQPGYAHWESLLSYGTYRYIYTPEAWHSIKITANDGTFRLFVDGSNVAQITYTGPYDNPTVCFSSSDIHQKGDYFEASDLRIRNFKLTFDD